MEEGPQTQFAKANSSQEQSKDTPTVLHFTPSIGEPLQVLTMCIWNVLTYLFYAPLMQFIIKIF